MPAHSALRLIEDLLDVSRIAQGKLDLRKRPLEPGGHVTVAARAEQHHVRLSVRDGMGVSRDLLAQIFDPLVQERREDGAQNGLGVALARSLTALHGGQVDAHSDGPGRGSEFVLRLPRMDKQPTMAETTGAIQTVTAGVRRRILLVDDNEDAAELLSMLLADAGHTVQIAHDAATALSLAPAMAPDVALLDIGLPVMDGYQLGTELRRRLGAHTPALVALTGYGQEKDRQRTAAAGFAAHLVKPIDPQHLLNVIETLVSPAGEAGTA